MSVYYATESQKIIDTMSLKHVEINVSEKTFAKALLHMTNQKVEANYKLGFILIDEQNIDNMQEILSHHTHYDNYDTYKEMLDEWEDNNFSHIKSQHNFLWKYLGEIGSKAHGVMDEETEKEFLKKNLEEKKRD